MLKHATPYGSGPTKIGAAQWDADHAVDDAPAMRAAIGMPGRVMVDSAYAQYTGDAGFTGVILLDSTVPQITEGDQIVALSYTPKAAGNRLRIRYRSGASCTNLNNVVAALFVGSGANAVAATAVTNTVAAYLHQITLETEVPAAGASAVTIQVRMGVSNAGGTYSPVNQAGSGAVLGAGIAQATLVVEELTP